MSTTVAKNFTDTQGLQLLLAIGAVLLEDEPVIPRHIGRTRAVRAPNRVAPSVAGHLANAGTKVRSS